MMTQGEAIGVAAAVGVVVVFGGWLWWMRSNPPAATLETLPPTPNPTPVGRLRFR